MPRKAEITLQAYFAALYHAANLTVEQMGAAGDTVGMGIEPYATAYKYWSSELQAKQPYEAFLASWEGTSKTY